VVQIYREMACWFLGAKAKELATFLLEGELRISVDALSISQ